MTWWKGNETSDLFPISPEVSEESTRWHLIQRDIRNSDIDSEQSREGRQNRLLSHSQLGHLEVPLIERECATQ